MGCLVDVDDDLRLSRWGRGRFYAAGAAGGDCHSRFVSEEIDLILFAELSSINEGELLEEF